MKIRPYYHRSDRELAGTLLDLMVAQGLTEPPSIARAIDLIRQDLRQQHGDSVPALGTGRGIRVVDAWLPVVRAERAVIAAEQSGDTDALASAREAEAAAMRRAVMKTTDQLAAERERSEIRRKVAKGSAVIGASYLRDRVKLLLEEAAYAGRDLDRNCRQIAAELLLRFDEAVAATEVKNRPGRKPKVVSVDQLIPSEPVDQNPSSAPVDQLDPSVPVDQLTIHNDPRQVSLLADQ